MPLHRTGRPWLGPRAGAAGGRLLSRAAGPRRLPSWGVPGPVAPRRRRCGAPRQWRSPRGMISRRRSSTAYSMSTPPSRRRVPHQVGRATSAARRGGLVGRLQALAIRRVCPPSCPTQSYCPRTVRRWPGSGGGSACRSRPHTARVLGVSVVVRWLVTAARAGFRVMRRRWRLSRRRPLPPTSQPHRHHRLPPTCSSAAILPPTGRRALQA